MKKTALALSLVAAGLITTSVHAAALSSLDVTYGDFGMNALPDGPGGVNDWSGVLPMGTSGVLIADAFNFNNLFGMVDILANGSGLSGDETAIDLTNFAVDYNGTNIPQSPDAGSLTQTIGGGNFSADWSALIVGGPFDGNTGYWHMEGTYSVVPVPAAAWLFGSGLVGLVGVARRRKAA